MTNVGQSRPGLLHHLWKSALLSGLFAVALGVLILVWPGKSIIVAAVFLGIYLVVSGAAQVIFAFSLPVSAASRILLFVSGAASLVLAVLAFRHFGEGYASSSAASQRPSPLSVTRTCPDGDGRSSSASSRSLPASSCWRIRSIRSSH